MVLMKACLVGLTRLGQANVHVNVEHWDSIVKSQEVNGKGSLGSTWPDLVKVFQMQYSRWSNVSKLERWVCGKNDVFRNEHWQVNQVFKKI
jgi:hypothetical protein